MTDSSGSAPPFPGFPGFPPAEMLDRMWDMMRLSPFGSAFPGGQAAAAPGLGPSLSMMSDMMAPLTSVEELDKRITDMRAVEQWLKLNLNMLQSAIQALEVQRATLATLRAFGAFAQQSMAQPEAAPPKSAPAPSPAPGPKPDTAPPGAAGAAGASHHADDAASAPGFDASAWWNLLQSQFNQIAQFAMTPPGAAEAAGGAASTAGRTAGAAKAGKQETGKAAAPKREPAAKGAAGSRPRATAKKPPSQPE
jgi:hypothetical protein